MSNDFADTQEKTSMDAPPPKKKSWVPTCLIGCGIFVVVGALVCGGVTWYFVSQGPIMIADAIIGGIEESELPDEEKREVTKQIERVKDAYRSGKIGYKEFGEMAQKFAESPLLAMLIIFAADEKYIKPSGLDDQEKADAKRVLARVARGVTEEKIREHDMDDALDIISKSKGPNNQRQLKDSLSDEEVREFIVACKTVVDEKEIPDEDFEVKVSDAVKKIVDELLGEEG